MELYEVFTRDDDEGFGNIWNTDIISANLYLDENNPSEITFKMGR